MHLFIYLFVAYLWVHTWRSEGDFRESSLSFHRVNPGAHTRSIWLVIGHIYPENHPAGPSVRNLSLSLESPNLWYFCSSRLSEHNIISH